MIASRFLDDSGSGLVDILFSGVFAHGRIVYGRISGPMDGGDSKYTTTSLEVLVKFES